MSRAAQIRALATERCNVTEIALALGAEPSQVREVLVADVRYSGRLHSQRRIARAFNHWQDNQAARHPLGGSRP
ncbi:hypothetical protein P6166_04530 [Stenotrophomonas sp. HITSZ_GD]|uniref:hypothetical protein n=1 Tax=Stenotrophomonas sp. HITSZ_GD TaxID=3037248 RepID=UPI00240CF5E6|nr:hypothetical protein [Stenotrophomonas sp. HITSZ_GD]MDG2524623.1 hypothetical protein [Stenotrophomonas sp. HITSZ_GD]